MRQIKIHKILAALLIFCLGIMSSPGIFIPAPAYGLNEKITTAIVSIDSPTENDLPVRINDAITSAMVKSHRFEVTDRAQVASTLKDMQLENTSLNMTQACEIGKALGVSTITMVQGYGVQSDNEKCYINIAAQVVDVDTGIIIQSAFARGEGFKGEKFELTDEAITKGASTLVDQINNNLSKVGLIALIKDGEMRVNIGGDIGIKDNAEFAVYRDNKVIGKLKTMELDSYDTLVEKVIAVPSITLQEGDLVVVASNQGEEIQRVNGSPQTVQTDNTKVGLILLAILAGVAIAIIATNGSDNIQKQGGQSMDIKSYTYQGAGRFLVEVLVRDANGNPAPDGTAVTPITVSDAGFNNYWPEDLPLVYKTRNGVITFYASGTNWKPLVAVIPPAPDSNVTKSFTFALQADNYRSQNFISPGYASGP